MPYKVKKQGDQYVVYKKDTGKRVGATAGNKKALRKYMAALHINAKEGALNEDAQKVAKDLTQAYKSGPEATVNFLNQNAGDNDLKKVLQAPKEDGKEDDDDAGVGSVSGQAMSFSPTQSEIDLMKSVSYPLGSAKTLIDAINSGPIAQGVVADNEAKIIIDGHHRWSGAIAIGGDKAKIEGTDFKLPVLLATGQV